MVETGKLALGSSSLNPSEMRGLRAFVSQLQQTYPHHIRQVALFGSKVRGDSDYDSDVDVLIIVKQDDRSIRRGIINITSEISLEFDILLSPKVISELRWKTGQGFSLYRNIARDSLTISMSQDQE